MASPGSRTRRRGLAAAAVLFAMVLLFAVDQLRSSHPGLETENAPATPPDAWVLDLDEDFTALDLGRWQPKNETYSSNEDSYLLARNVSVADGVLRIAARSEAVGGRSWTSGYLEGTGYSLPDRFRIEVRARVPLQQGLWAAPLWLRQVDHSGGEIDLVETYGKDRDRPLVRQTIHTDYGPDHQQRGITTVLSSVSDASPTDWHIYTLEKTPGRLQMWIDGAPTASFGTGAPEWYDEYYEAEKQWELRINLQVGGRFRGLPDASTNWSPAASTMEVDYVRTWVPGWQRSEPSCQGQPTLECLPLTTWGAGTP